MGSYTPKQNFYQINGEELVNVDTDLNYNLNRADDRIPPLISYLKTDELTIGTSSLPKEIGFKWYKRRLNSFFAYSEAIPGNGNPTVNFNGSANPPTFNGNGLSFFSGWSSVDTGINLVQYTDGSNGNNAGTVRWRGRIKYNTTIPANTEMNVVTVPSAAIPLRDTSIMVVAGGVNTSPQFFRLLFRTTGVMSMIRYGTDSSAVIALGQVRYASTSGGRP